MTLEESAAKKRGEDVWRADEAVGGPFEAVKEQLNAHKLDEGPFVLGSKFSYRDCIEASFFECFSRADLTSYVRLMSFNISFSKLD